MTEILLGTVTLALLAMVVEAAIGYPSWVYARIRHPVSWAGRLISGLEQRWNHGPASARYRKGLWALVVLLLVASIVGLAAQALVITGLLLGLLLAAVFGSTLIAQRALADHVRAVADGLDQGLDQGRAAVAMIVGRDVQGLDEAGVARAAIESLAENFSDGVTAPVVWMALAGLPGAALYKAINTADSMIGHRSARYVDYGRSAARLDDCMNWLPARVSGVLLALAGGLMPGASAGAAWAAMRADARYHRSPNAGWPEAAMAGALGVSLAGPRVYDGVEVADRAMNPTGRRSLRAADIRRALRLFWLADALLAILLGVLLFALCGISRL